MPTPIYNKPNYANGLWAYAGTISIPADEKVAIGHVIERPPYEISNYLENRQDQGIAYLLQHGIADWDNITTYPKFALVKKDGKVYEAIDENDNTDPSANATIWKRAFFSYTEGFNLATVVSNIQTQEGFLSLYVSKANPVLTGRAQGHGYLADSGLPINGSENLGFVFNGALLDGLYHDGSVPVILNDGSIVARFQTPASITESTKNVVTMDILRAALGSQQGYGIGDIYITTTSGDPATRLGYGTWEKFAQGLTLVGHSDVGSSPNWTRTAGTVFGSYDVSLTIANLPSHRHSEAPWDKFGSMAGDFPRGNFTATNYDYTPSEMRISDINPAQWAASTEKYVGENTPFSNVQPSIVVYMWRRTA